ncbi:MAG: flagellar hook-associated protein FlgK [Methylomonas sp.]|jgi:flagellar hook-associated protein 1|nr:MAG: flagellar hook-associated protein FlgK [Methylomonas sp.]
MSIGIINSAISGLAAFQRSLDVTSNNIANVNTEGYSRQRVELQTRPEQYSGNGYMGSGVNVATIKRSYDEFINNQVRASSTAFHDVDNFYRLSSRIDNLLADQSTGLSSAMKTFFNSVNDVANDPTSLPARQVMLSEGDAIAKHFNSLSARFEEIRQQVNNNLETSVQEVNAFAKSIANLNQQITDAIGKSQGLQLPNALMDQRDLLLAKMAEKMDIAVVPQPNGSFSVFAGQGQPLILGNHASSLSLQAALDDPSRRMLMMNGEDISHTLTGGQIYGSIRFRDGMLDPAQQQMGLMASGLAEEFNAVYRNGYDMQGQNGQNFFELGTPTAQVRVTAGDTALKVTAVYLPPDPLDLSITNPTQNWGASYRVTVTGIDTYQLTNLSTNQAVDLSSFGELTDTAAANGFSINIDGTQTQGDTFIISPHFNMAGSIKLNQNIASPKQIAAAAAPGLAGDNSIALQLAGLESKNLMMGGKSSLSQIYGQIVATVGSQTRTAMVGRSAQEVLFNQATAAREDLAGVNLDEEAANLIKFQNAYQAAARAVSVASNLFDTLIGIVR